MKTGNTGEGRRNVENAPRYRIMVTRHEERLPSGTLSPEGIRAAKAKGENMRGGVEVLKAHASDHPSDRAYQTVELISESADIRSKRTRERFSTRRRPGIHHGILEPDMKHLLVEAKDAIDEATLQEAGLSTDRDEHGKLKINIDKLPIEEQERLAPIRKAQQAAGFDMIIENSKAVRRMASGMAHQLLRETEILKRYRDRRNHGVFGGFRRPKGDVVFNTGTHGMMMDSLFREAGVSVDVSGKQTSGVAMSEIGGYIDPGESVYLDLGALKKKRRKLRGKRTSGVEAAPDLIPVVFEGGDRPKEGRIFFDRNKLEALALEYENTQKQRSSSQEV